MHRYEIKNPEQLITPCLIYYLDMIKTNTEKAIALAGSAKRLWPHVKSHKAAEMVKLQIGYGITKFKTATIAEAEMAAAAGAEAVILAYPLVGPGPDRLIRLMKAYPNTEFYAIADHVSSLKLLSDTCEQQQCPVNVLIDVNMGMNRTGIVVSELEALYRYADTLSGLKLRGLHCYDGNHNQREFRERDQAVAACDHQILAIMERLKADGLCCEIAVAGGTPSFPCHAKDSEWYLSPGTAFLTDAGYYHSLPDLDFEPAAALLTRVVSHPAPGLFTLDLGYKGIAADPAAQRGYIVGMEDAAVVLHSEEHWVFKRTTDAPVPAIGSCLYVIPTHICPTSALYPEILVVQNKRIVDVWEVTARNRKLNF